MALRSDWSSPVAPRGLRLREHPSSAAAEAREHISYYERANRQHHAGSVVTLRNTDMARVLSTPVDAIIREARGGGGRGSNGNGGASGRKNVERKAACSPRPSMLRSTKREDARSAHRPFTIHTQGPRQRAATADGAAAQSSED